MQLIEIPAIIFVNDSDQRIEEIIVLRVHNDIAMAIDNGHSVILVLLDLSATFDTADH